MLPSESPEMQCLEDNVDSKIVLLTEEYINSHPDKYHGSNEMWKYINKKLFDNYFIKLDSKTFLAKFKKDVIKNVKKYNDLEKRGKYFFRLVNNYLPIFDLMPPRTIKIENLLNQDRYLRNRNSRAIDNLKRRSNAIIDNLRDITSPKKYRTRVSSSYRRKPDKSPVTDRNATVNLSVAQEASKKGNFQLNSSNNQTCSIPSCSYNVSSSKEDVCKKSDFVRCKLKRNQFLQCQENNCGIVGSSIKDSKIQKRFNVRGLQTDKTVNIPSSSVTSNTLISKTAAIKPYTASCNPPPSINNFIISRNIRQSENNILSPTLLPSAFYESLSTGRYGISENPDTDTPPEWFQLLFNDYKAHEMWKLRQLFEMERTFMDIESRKLSALVRISESLVKKQ